MLLMCVRTAGIVMILILILLPIISNTDTVIQTGDNTDLKKYHQ